MFVVLATAVEGVTKGQFYCQGNIMEDRLHVDCEAKRCLKGCGLWEN